MTDARPEAKTPFWARCAACGHCWAAAYLPMDVETFAKTIGGGRRCPACGGGKIVVAKQNDGTLLESGQ